MNFQEFLSILWSQAPSGTNGFEGLISKLLEKATGQRFFLSSSGRQEGRDVSSEGVVGNFITAECKRYTEGSSLKSDELLVKLMRAATSTLTPDIWLVVTTKRLSEQHHRDIKNVADQFGISYFPIDGEGDEKSMLLALCTCSPEIIATHLRENPPHIDSTTAQEIDRYLSNLIQDGSISASLKYVQDVLGGDIVGYEDWRVKQNHWLLQRFENPTKSYADFAQNLAVHEPECKLVTRNQAQKRIDEWWARWPEERKKLVILGEEGDGKSWLTADWLADNLAKGLLPPVIFVPSTRITDADPKKLISQEIQWHIGQTKDYWERRLKRWISHSQQAPLFFLVLDGLNERPGFEWRQFLSHLETEPFVDQVAILMTCRSLFWSERIHHGGFACDCYSLEPYNDEELNHALRLQGLQRESFDNKLLPLLSKPRYLDLTIKLKDRLSEQGDVTVERLIYEDYRDQLSRKIGHADLLTNDEFQEIITNLSKRWSKKRELKRKDVHDELSQYGDGKALLDELRSGRILRSDRKKWVVDPRYLILGLGLLLADEVEQTIPEGEGAIEELIASRLEPQPDMDLKVSICGMALLHSMCREDYPDAGRMAIFRAWIRGRNIQHDDWQNIPAYLPKQPHIYFKMAEYLWSKTGENREAQDALMAGFLRFGKEEKVLSEMIPRFERWMGFIHPDGHHGKHANNEEERQNSREKVREALGADVESGVIDYFGYRLELTRDEALLRLAAVALAVISHQNRRPYIRALSTYALSSSIMGYPGYQSIFDWVLRISPDDIEESVLSVSQDFMKAAEPTTQRAAFWFLSALRTDEGLKLRDEIPAEHRFKNPVYEFYEKDPCGGIFLWDRDTYWMCIEKSQFHPTIIAKKLKAVALEPGLPIPEEFHEKLYSAGSDLNLNNMRIALDRTFKDLTLEELEPALCAWRPDCLAEIWKDLVSQLQVRNGISRRLLAFAIYDHLLLFGDAEMKIIEIAWKAVLSSDDSDKEDQFDENILFPCVLWGQSLDNQLDIIEARGDCNGAFNGHPARIKKISDHDLPMIVARLRKTIESNAYANNLLYQLAKGQFTPNEEIHNLILKIFHQSETIIRGLCLEIFTKIGDKKAANNLIENGWRADAAKGDYEKHWGSILLGEFCTQIAFSDLADRILPSQLGYAIQCRGNREEEVAAYAELLNMIWRRMAALEPLNFPGSERTTVETGWVENDADTFKAWKINGDHETELTFKSYDSIWGGGIKNINTKDMRDLFNLDKRTQIHNETNKRLYDLAKTEQKSGNLWFLNPLDRSVFEIIIKIHPSYVNDWVEAVLKDSSDSRFILARFRSFYESICDALLNCIPEMGVKLFKRLHADNNFQLVDNNTEIKSLLFSLFDAKDSDPVLQLRRELLENCTSDKTLFEMAFLAQFHGRQRWLHEIIESWLVSHSFDRARGLTLLGFLDNPLAEDQLQKWIDDQRDSWLRDRAKMAMHVFQRNMWAKQWFTIFLTHEDTLQAWAAFRLFLHCVDRRFWLWGPEMIKGSEKTDRINYYMSNKTNVRKAALKNEKDTLKLEKKLVFDDIQENQAWPWMKQYFSR